jgi:hypothetical protein
MPSSNGIQKVQTKRVNWQITLENLDLIQDECDRRAIIEGGKVAPCRIMNEKIPQMFERAGNKRKRRRKNTAANAAD